MLILLTKWGLLKYDPMTNFYVNWDWIRDSINNEQYIVSIWFFKHLPNMFKRSYVLFAPEGVKNKKDVMKVIKKFESYQQIDLPDDVKNDIMKVASETFEKGHHMFYKAEIK